ncbi:prenyltransferase/squalene oxidase repeat-containing protein [Streptomyces sp. DSM 44915]|uniref:Prenyltransferase/squalene oxidase repeat-containing protein n=1 Tax=Streptomyces chisholmiae TaxID=3075540 RepID=A0ABU2JP27_9ACTN|nr:prenyltransferase/squalene oxidase repeat-containing protein [Streptomyces sp. DSM 44915]MDT0266746.1 prenyltransferase/squalene oxidase repeat-containing protein [Streptomyces sp. DSM 44915]
MAGAEETGRLVLPGVLTAAQAEATAGWIAGQQRADGAIPWSTGQHLDPWDHVEAAMALDTAGEHRRAAAAYDWLAEHQNPDGSWYAGYADGDPTRPSDLGRESNFCAYPAVGVLHHYLATGDDAFRRRLWPTVRAAVDFVLRLQRDGGQLGWRQEADGRAVPDALLTGSASGYQALRCALALAELAGEAQPDWEIAAGRLGHAVRRHPELFLDKSRYSMDWYYPVLAGAVRGQAASERLDRHWAEFVVPGLGVRCVRENPWVTGGESAELALALWSVGREREAVEILRAIGRLRTADGRYWTGYVYPDDAFWPVEQTTWTAGAVLLAVAALTGDPPTTAVFGGARLPRGLDRDCRDCPR